MKYLGFAFALLVVATVNAATSLPPDLLGVWATPGSEFHGDAIWKGQAIYLDVDGVGAIAGGDGTDVLGVRIVLTSYDRTSHVIGIDLTENGKVEAHKTLEFDMKNQALVDPESSQRYYRRINQVSASIRRALGLEPRSQ